MLVCTWRRAADLAPSDWAVPKHYTAVDPEAVRTQAVKLLGYGLPSPTCGRGSLNADVGSSNGHSGAPVLMDTQADNARHRPPGPPRCISQAKAIVSILPHYQDTEELFLWHILEHIR